MKIEKSTLKQKIQNLKQEERLSQQKASYAKELCEAALENEKTTVAELKEYSNLKTELGKFGLSIENDLPKFVQVVHGIKQSGYDVDKVLSEYSDQEIKQLTRDLLINQVEGLKGTKMELQNESYFLKSQVDQHRQRLSVYDELKSMGFGLGELKILYDTIREIADEYNFHDYRMLINELY